MKFSMFLIGVGFFDNVVPHDEFKVFGENQLPSVPIAAGTAYLKQVDVATKVVSLTGRSIMLGINASAAYPDWIERHSASGVSPECVVYLTNLKVFFFPFARISRFIVCGIGESKGLYTTTVDELVAYIATKR